MKRLLAYLFIVLGLGLMFNVNASAESGYCIDGLTSKFYRDKDGKKYFLKGSYWVKKIKNRKNYYDCHEEEFISKAKYEVQYKKIKKLVGPFKKEKSIPLNSILTSIKGTHVLVEYNRIYESINNTQIAKAEPSQTQKVAKKDVEYFCIVHRGKGIYDFLPSYSLVIKNKKCDFKIDNINAKRSFSQIVKDYGFGKSILASNDIRNITIEDNIFKKTDGYPGLLFLNKQTQIAKAKEEPIQTIIYRANANGDVNRKKGSGNFYQGISSLSMADAINNAIDTCEKTPHYKNNKCEIFKTFEEKIVLEVDNSGLIKEQDEQKIEITKVEPTIIPKKKVKVANVEDNTQEEFKPKKTNQDNEAPVIEIAEAITVDSQAYTLKGKVKDKSQVYLTIDGRQVDVKKGKFEFPGFVIDPSEGEVLKIVAIDRWQNKSEKTINIKVEFKQTANARSYEKPNPNNIRTKTDNDKIGIIIGIEKYQALSNLDAPYANRDANAFRAYATRALGIPNKNLKVLIDNEANRSGLLKTLKIWLPQMTRGKSKDIYIFFAGHGLASDDGKDLHILPQDGDPILLEETALSRIQMFDLINKVSPKSVTMFFDTCYSGQTRSEQMLVAGLRPVRIVADEQDTPNNFTIFTASNYDQTSGSINEAEHGIFSYYLMKGLEGNADANKDKELTNGELIAYLKNNVSQEAFTQNRSQEPMLAGDPDKVLMSYR